MSRLLNAAPATAVLLLLLLSPAASLRAQSSPARPSRRTPARAPFVVSAANVLDKMYFKERGESEISPAALAAYGNQLVAQRGLDFMFDACAVFKSGARPRPVPGATETTRAFDYPLRPVGGAPVNFRFVTDILGEVSGAECGECVFEVPALRVSKREMTVVAGGRRYRVGRPRGFLLQEVSLSEGPSKKARRAWQLPFQQVPLGLSPDRTRLYLPLPDFEDVDWDDKLALEISDAGVRFVVRGRLSLPPHERLADAAVSPDSTDEGASFVRYGTGAQSYVLRLADPCD